MYLAKQIGLQEGMKAQTVKYRCSSANLKLSIPCMYELNLYC
jgi:hypothetical protein